MAEGDVAAPAVIRADRWAEKTRVARYLMANESHKTVRREYDVRDQYVSDYILPRRDFSVTLRPGQIRPHRVTSSLARTLNYRAAVMLLTYLVDTSRPFMLPNVKSGLAMAGRVSNLDDRSINYLGGMQQTVFDAMLRPRANFLMRLLAILTEYCAFGRGVMFTARKRGFGPVFTTRGAASCWWGLDEHEEVDNLHEIFKLPLYRMEERWPEAVKRGWADRKIDRGDQQELFDILKVCGPREGGRMGAATLAKPVELVTICMDKEVILDEGGFDSFPYQVFRRGPLPGEAYCEGMAGAALPDVMVLNHLVQVIENAASQKADPAIAVPARMFAKTLDRRPSAINPYNPTGLGLQSADKAIIKLDLTGDPGPAMEVCKTLIDNIEKAFMADVFTLRETGDMTAEEVNARTDLNMRGGAGEAANIGSPFSHLADRVQMILQAEGVFPPPPEALRRADVDWEYAGPLQIAQLQKNVSGMMQMLNATALVAKMGPDGEAAAQTTDLESSLRVIHDALGLPPGTQNSHDKVVAFRRQQAQATQQAQAAQLAQAHAKAASDGAGAAATALDAIKNYAGGAGGGAPGGPPAPFAPAAPFQQAA